MSAPADPDPEALPQPTPEEDEPSKVRRSWLVFWARWYALPVVLGLVAVVVSVLVWYLHGFRPVAAGWVLSIVPAILIWIAIRVYYNHLFVVDRSEGSDRLRIAIWSVPLDLWPHVRLKGSVGMAEDAYGRDLHIVRKFDPDTLEGESPWAAGLTPLHFAARWSLVDQVISWCQRIIKRYGEGRTRARADLLRDYDSLARYVDRVLKLKEADRILDDMEAKPDVPAERRTP